jgi:hypothetical protein
MKRTGSSWNVHDILISSGMPCLTSKMPLRWLDTGHGHIDLPGSQLERQQAVSELFRSPPGRMSSGVYPATWKRQA